MVFFCSRERGGGGGGGAMVLWELCFSLCWLLVCEFYVPCAHTSDDACGYWLRSQLRVSPPQPGRTLDSTLGSTGGSCRAALGSINFIAYFYNLPSLYAPTIASLRICFNCSHSCGICVSPCFMLAWSSRLSRFLYSSLDALLNICGYLLLLFPLFFSFDGVFFIFLVVIVQGGGSRDDVEAHFRFSWNLSGVCAYLNQTWR